MAKEKLGVKRKHIYRLHRDEETDHKYGRPALLLNGRITKSLVWTGTTKIDEFNKEEPLTLKLNDIPVYFYGNAIELVLTKELKKDWINNETKQPYVLTSEQEDTVLKKFISMSKLKNPYLRIEQLETSIEATKIKHAKTKHINYKLLEENKTLKLDKEKLRIENQNLSMENRTLNSENQLLKSRNKSKTLSEYERE